MQTGLSRSLAVKGKRETVVSRREKDRRTLRVSGCRENSEIRGWLEGQVGDRRDQCKGHLFLDNTRGNGGVRMCHKAPIWRAA